MATLKRRKIYKNNGASYSREGVRASVYCGPKMFSNGPPETIEIGDAGLAAPVDLTAEKAAKEQAKADKKAAADTAKAAKAKVREDAKAAKLAAKVAAAAKPATAPEVSAAI